ncbi:MAG: hypothetical protein A2898_02580 [Candidatus Kerfeldbacteria bacterium RIFCSPLOWO2_01_FULL_48_11]|uniref:DUF3467 domain-containing protein n=1 Tax=Candidatus Kerfeldbacteria bacterium RIFCSPLOWO2_01_FULL_48_11 TaxID=1798543 RepID=A0A1G2B4I3_9BACT|nr:MAG: hypothetical protein UY34_C0041G0007 [Parcubacteria group bacterium GW2011_GWA2_48_9]KKW14733.1 MAG: hypothetical protein UY52_C0022G0012 [Parcubacteria group bacterium GW2011_GWC2_49_9]OGY83137.1 MAG: hypothetical protein A2898_02580 [Candidatus Kerfeldbacteria bacterium RIFCSPLOWO2_01_FULL_48_11]HCJ52810.1 DUF3467 domain-containing protein [Candidatus Kerfeldbacteria bacterium]HCM67948.1 DUF3467 domain-containing protein [Candidatus Kerfeldbacteria bacterium]
MNGQPIPQTGPAGQSQQIQIKIEDSVMKGTYANMMSVAHSKEEFVMDFLNVFPAQRAGILTSRVIVSPGHMKRILKAMEENLKKYESNFGKIEEAKVPGSEVGFRT